MKQHKTLRISLIVGAVLLVFAMGVGAAVGVQQITASLRPDVTVELDGQSQAMTDQNGNRVYPISYNGTTYLPIRAIGTLLEQEVVWNSATQTVSLTRRTETPPEALTYEALALRTKTLEGRYTTLISDMDETAKAATYAENLNIWNRLDSRRVTLMNDGKTLLVDVSEAARLGKLTQVQKTDFISRLSNLDTKLTTLRNTMITKYGVDAANVTVQELQTQIAQLQASLKTLDSLVAATELAKDEAAWKTADLNARNGCKTFRDSLYALQLALNDSLRRSAITYTQYSDLAAEADRLDVACKNLRERMDAACAKWNGTAKPDDSQNDQDNAYYTAQITALGSEADGLLVKCRDYFTNKTRDQKTGAALLAQVNDLENRIDTLEDAIERSDKLGRQTVWTLLRQLDRADNAADKAGDFLERAGLDNDDDDDDDHDRGWHNGRGDDDD